MRHKNASSMFTHYILYFVSIAAVSVTVFVHEKLWVNAEKFTLKCQAVAEQQKNSDYFFHVAPCVEPYRVHVIHVARKVLIISFTKTYKTFIKLIPETQMTVHISEEWYMGYLLYVAAVHNM